MKGVSPVVATVLMVAVAIAAAVVAYSWLMSMQSQIQAEASRGASTVGKELLSIASVYCDDANAGTGDLHAVLRNIGDEDITGEFTFYVKDAATSQVVASEVSSGVSVSAKQDRDVNTTIECNNLPDVIIVEAHAPGGAVVSARQRIR